MAVADNDTRDAEGVMSDVVETDVAQAVETMPAFTG